MSLTNYTKHDFVYTFDPVAGYSGQDSVVAPGNGQAGSYLQEWTLGDPIISNVYDGFWYFNNALTNNFWVENYSVSQ
jgi:hypothetical protein